MTIITFESSILRVCPPWLRRTVGRQLMGTFGASLDTIQGVLADAIKARFPQTAPVDALPALGRERGIIRGRWETDASYAARLVGWIDDRRRKGNPYALLRQIQGYFSPFRPLVRVVSNAGAWYTIDTLGVKSYYLGAWDWDGITAAWSRYWLIIYPPFILPGVRLWSKRKWGSNGTWGSGSRRWGCSITAAEQDDIYTIIRSWNPPHARCAWVILSFDQTAFDPTNTAPPNPDGTWGGWSVDTGGVQVASRFGNACYAVGPT